MNRFFAAAFVMSSSVGSAALAQSASSVSPLSPLYVCAEKTDPVQRLACFDAAVAAVKAAEGRSDIVALDKPRVEAVRREAFGFRIPSLPRFGLGGPSAPTVSAQSSATSATIRPREEIEDAQTFAVARIGAAGNRVAIYLENGNVWHMTEAGELNAPRQTPFNVRIRSAAMGSYMLTVEGRNKGYRVRRVE